VEICSPKLGLRAEEVGNLSAAEAAFDLAVVDPDAQVRAQLAVQLGEVTAVATYPGVTALVERLRPGQPAVVVFGPGFSDGAGLAEIEAMSRARPEVGAILVAEELSTGLLKQALRCGVRDVLGDPFDAESLQESVDRVGRTLAVVPGGPPGGAPQGEGQGRVITVSSTKGGSGKSVVATNLAVALAKRSDRPVALVDADLQFGDVAVLLGLTVPHTIVEAVSSIDRLDAQFLQSLLVRHSPSGLMVLPGPVEPAFADRVSGADVVRIIEVLQSFCGHVVIDTPAQFNDVVLAVIDHSDDVLLVAGLDIPSVKNVKLGLQTLRLLSVPEAKLRLLVNRADSKVRLDIAEVERSLGMKADSLIPSDIVVPKSVNKGIPVVLDAPKAPVTKAFEDLAGLFLSSGAEVPISKARSRFGLF
jgi:pilus assembly protein CpaE